MKNFRIIYSSTKLIEFKTNIKIVGIAEEGKGKGDSSYSFVQKFNWFIKFIDYMIVLYLSNDFIISFSEFFNKLKIKNIIFEFDKVNETDLNHYFSQLKRRGLLKKYYLCGGEYYL